MTLQSLWFRGGLKSLDRITWYDRFYDMANRGRDHVTYVLEAKATILGYVTVTFDHTTMDIDEVAVDQNILGKGYGAALIRWAETCARQACVEKIRLWGVDSKVPQYRHFGYEELGREMQLEDGKYLLMSKRVLYHI